MGCVCLEGRCLPRDGVPLPPVDRMTDTCEISSGSRGRVRGGAKKHEIYVAAFGGHLFYDLFSQGQGGPWPPRPPLDPLLEIIIPMVPKEATYSLGPFALSERKYGCVALLIFALM